MTFEAIGYGESDKVSPETFGLHLGPPLWPDRLAERRDVRVAVIDLRAAQRYVYGEHVRNLAGLAAQHLEAIHDLDPIDVVAMPDGTYLLGEGHHRAAAAILRGDKTLLVRIAGRVA